MSSVRRLSIVDQTMAHIREGVREGRWSGKLPGVRPLSRELGVSRESLRNALRRLSEEGLLAEDGPGGARRILRRETPARRDTLRIAILPARHMHTESTADRLLILRLMHDLESAGHACVLAPPSWSGDEPTPATLEQLVRDKDADAWMIYQGPRDLLKWFSEQKFPTLALGGNNLALPMAAVGFDYPGAVREATRALLAGGHRRIVFIAPRFARTPTPARPVRTFLDELAAAGVTTGRYNVPDWDESPAGLRSLLVSLFSLTPPSAILTWDGFEASGVLSFLAERKLATPRHVSLVALTNDPGVVWQNPGVRLANCEQDPEPFIRHCLRWADDAARGRATKHNELLPVRFDSGNTLGPLPR